MNVIFFGTPDFAAVHLRSLARVRGVNLCVAITNPDRPSGRGGKLSPSPVKIAAQELGIPVLQPVSIKRGLTGFLESLQSFGPFDIGVVVAFGQILPAEVLSQPKQGCINVHASLLPRWRGAAPIHRAIMAGDQKTGISLMKMDVGLDTGPVYATTNLNIDPKDTTGSLHDKLAQLGSIFLAENISRITSGVLSAIEQPSEGVTYAHKISNEEAHIDWSLPAPIIHNTIRGLSPAPGAFTMLNNHRIKIFASKIIKEDHTEQPGKVLSASGYDLRIACGHGTLGVLELQLEGKKRLPVEEFIKGGTITPFMVLG